MNTFPLGAFATLDLESTSVDVEDARTVEICLALVVPGRDTEVRHTLIDPGVEIPAEAAAVHGISTERARAEGKPAADTLDLYLGDIASAVQSGMALVVMNAPYDLSVLDREARRHGLPTLHDRLGDTPLAVLDPLVLDKHLIKYRRRVSETQGARCLKTLAQVYRVPWDDEKAHGAEYDALQAGRVVWRIGQWACLPHAELMALELGPHVPPKPMHRNDAAKFRALAGMSLEELHAAQVRWYAEQSADFGDWLRTKANEARHVVEKARDRGDDEALAAAEQELSETEARIDGMSYDWPIKPLVVAS